MGFSFDDQLHLNHVRFNNLISHFMAHISSNDANVYCRRLDLAHAMSQAISLLNNYSGGNYRDGYERVCHEACHPDWSGGSWVIELMSELLKEKKRKQYTDWVFTTTISSQEWGMKVRIVESLTRQHQATFQSVTSQMSPSRLPECLPELIELLLHTERVAAQATASHF